MLAKARGISTIYVDKNQVLSNCHSVDAEVKIVCVDYSLIPI